MEASKVKDWLKAKALLLLVGLVAIGSIIYIVVDRSSTKDRFSFDSREVPSEYLYLDADRVAAYLAQIQGGTAGAEKRSTVRERSGQLLVDTGIAVEGGANLKVQETIDRVIASTEASNFLQLVDKLDNEDLQSPIRVQHIDAETTPQDFSRNLGALREGDFVYIHNSRVLLPIYARPFDAIKRFGSLEVVGDEDAIARLRRNIRHRKRLLAYAKRIGPNPRLVLNIGARPGEDGPDYGRNMDCKKLAGAEATGMSTWKKKAQGCLKQPMPKGVKIPPLTARFVRGCPATISNWQDHFSQRWPRPTRLNPVNARVVVPVQYARLTGDDSLLSGGYSTIFGKVTRVLRVPGLLNERPRVTDVCYRDVNVFNAFALRQRLLPRATLAAFRDITGVPINWTRLGDSLGGDTRVIAPAAVVVPVAIYRDERRVENAYAGIEPPRREAPGSVLRALFSD